MRTPNETLMKELKEREEEDLLRKTKLTFYLVELIEKELDTSNIEQYQQSFSHDKISDNRIIFQRIKKLIRLLDKRNNTAIHSDMIYHLSQHMETYLRLETGRYKRFKPTFLANKKSDSELLTVSAVYTLEKLYKIMRLAETFSADIKNEQNRYNFKEEKAVIHDFCSIHSLDWEQTYSQAR